MSLSESTKIRVYYDLETTGLDVINDQILEIAAATEDCANEFSSYVKPSIPIPAAASAIHKITDSVVANEDRFAGVYDRFIAFLAKLRASTQHTIVLIAHNNFGFDWLVLRNECARTQKEIPAWIEFADTLDIIRQHYTLPLTELRLETLSNGVLQTKTKIVQTHAALDDTKLLIRTIARFNEAFRECMLRELCTQARSDSKLWESKMKTKSCSAGGLC